MPQLVMHVRAQPIPQRLQHYGLSIISLAPLGFGVLHFFRHLLLVVAPYILILFVMSQSSLLLSFLKLQVQG